MAKGKIEGKPGTYADGGMPDTEKLTTTEVGHGYRVGQAVEIVKDIADDIKAGARAVITEIDNHPELPIRVDVHKLGGQGFTFGLLVHLDEIAPVGAPTPPREPEGAAEAPEDASEGEGDLSGVAA